LGKYINILVSVIDGEFLEKPITQSFECSRINPSGETALRTYDANDCIIVKRVFAFMYGGIMFGTPTFTSYLQFVEYRNRVCVPCSNRPEACDVLFNGCYVTFRGCNVTINKNKISHGV
jgi:hypothetical protein